MSGHADHDPTMLKSCGQPRGAFVSAGFDRVEVINLQARKDRRAEITKELARLDAFFGDGTTHLLEAAKFSEAGGFSTTGARGCFESHLRALRRGRATGANRLAIIEDDCDFARDAHTRMAELNEAPPFEFCDVFYGGHLEWDGIGRAQKGQTWVSARSEEAIVGAHFVGFSSRAINLLIPYLEQMLLREPGAPLGGPMHVDGAYSWFRREHPDMMTLVACPPLATQRPSRTDIHELRAYDRLPVAREAVTLARRLKRALQR